MKMLYIKLFIEREKNTGQAAPECPFKLQILYYYLYCLFILCVLFYLIYIILFATMWW